MPRKTLRSSVAIELAKELNKLTWSEIVFYVKIDSSTIRVIFNPSTYSSPSRFEIFSSYPLSSLEENKLYRRIGKKIKQLKRFIELFKDREKEDIMFLLLTDTKFTSLPPLDQVEKFTKEKIKEIESTLKELGPSPSLLTIEKEVRNERGESIGHISWRPHHYGSDSFVGIYIPSDFPSYQNLPDIEKALWRFKEEMRRIKEALENTK